MNKELSSAYTLIAADNDTDFVCTGSFAITVGSPSDFARDFDVIIKNDGSGTVTLGGYVAKTLAPGASCRLTNIVSKWVVNDMDEAISGLPLGVAQGGTGVTTEADLRTALYSEITLPNATPVNAVAASKVLTVAGVPADGNTVSVGGKTYKYRDAIGAGAKATGLLTFNTELPHAGDIVILGLQTYTFVASLSAGPTIPNEILIEATVTLTIDNLVAAIMGTAGEGTKYSVGTAYYGGVITVTKASADTFAVEYNAIGFLGNSFDTLGTLTHATWGATALAGGVDAQAANDVLIGISAETAIDNLVLAITAGAGIGVNYGTATTVNTLATASKASAATMTATNLIKGIIGNSTAIAAAGADLSWAGGAVLLSGGVNGTVGKKDTVYVDASKIWVCTAANTINDANWKYASLT